MIVIATVHSIMLTSLVITTILTVSVLSWLLCSVMVVIRNVYGYDCDHNGCRGTGRQVTNCPELALRALACLLGAFHSRAL